jgi:hypothetical protein
MMFALAIYYMFILVTIWFVFIVCGADKEDRARLVDPVLES